METRPEDPHGPPVWDRYGTVYGMMGTAVADGQDGLVKNVASDVELASEQLALLFVAVPITQGGSKELFMMLSSAASRWLQLVGYA